MRYITVTGKTSPYEVTLTSKNEPFAVDEYLTINDQINNNPICRVVSSETIKEDGALRFFAIAKIETPVRYPIESGASAKTPTFDSLKRLVMKTEPADGLVLGEVAGTSFGDIPQNYQDLISMYDGQAFYKQTAIPFVFNYRKLYESPHIGLFGGSGSGKTVAMKVVLEEIMKKGIPGIILDPHLEMNFSANDQRVPAKHQYNFSPCVETFCVGKNHFAINFADLTTDQLIRIMSFSGELSGPMDALLRTLHKSGSTLFELRDLLDKLIELMNKLEQGYELDSNDMLLNKNYLSKVPSFNTLIALSWRLNALENSGVFDGDESPLVTALKNRKMCVLRGSMEQIHVVASHIIEKIYQMRRDYIDSRESGMDAEPFPPFFVGMDEAHIFCPNNTAFSLTKKTLRTIAQEGRKYGVFELLATQRPSLLDETVVAQMANKLIFRLSIKEDLESIKKETDLSDAEIKKLPYMQSGDCYVSSAIVGRTTFVKMRYGTTVAKNIVNPFDEIASVNKPLTDEENAILECLPFNDLKKIDVIKMVSDKVGHEVPVPRFNALCDNLAAKSLLKIENTFMGNVYRPA